MQLNLIQKDLRQPDVFIWIWKWCTHEWFDEKSLQIFIKSMNVSGICIAYTIILIGCLIYASLFKWKWNRSNFRWFCIFKYTHSISWWLFDFKLIHWMVRNGSSGRTGLGWIINIFVNFYLSKNNLFEAVSVIQK